VYSNIFFVVNQLRMKQWKNISRKDEKEFINVIYKCAGVKTVSPLNILGHWYWRI